MRKNTSIIAFLILLSSLSACQRKAVLGPQVDNMSSLSSPPMGASTYNDELKKELYLLEKIFMGSLDQNLQINVKKALMSGTGSKILYKEHSEASYLARLYASLPELVHQSDNLSQMARMWIKAKLLFLRRRFVEAATLMTEVLKIEPDFIEARNWRARAIFFLGNLDMALSELDWIIQKTQQKEELLDALYLKGAIIFESEEEDVARLEIGIKAWQDYLSRIDEKQNLYQEVSTSLSELKRRLLKKEPIELNNSLMPSANYSAAKNAVLKAFQKEELLLSLELAQELLKEGYDKELALVKARIFIRTNRIDEAHKEFSDLVQRNKNYVEAWHYLGMAHMMKGQVKEAILAWQKALELNPAYANFHNLPKRINVAQNMLSPTQIEPH